MKEAIILLIIFGIAAIAKAIVIVPPVIYIASFSITSFIFNAFAFIAVFAAAKGAINKFYFGKRPHEVVGIILSFFAYVAVISIASFVSIKLFDPIDLITVIYASIFSALLCFVVISLYNVRRYILVNKVKKKSILISAMLFTLFEFILMFVSAYNSINTDVILTSTNGRMEYGEDANRYEDSVRSGLSFSPLEKSEDAKSKKEVQKKYLTQAFLWFVPYKDGECEIYGNGFIIKKEESRGKCFYYDNEGKTIRTKCPVTLGVSDIDPTLYRRSSKIMIEGRGSCDENYSVIIMSDGFKNIP